MDSTAILGYLLWAYLNIKPLNLVYIVYISLKSQVVLGNFKKIIMLEYIYVSYNTSINTRIHRIYIYDTMSTYFLTSFNKLVMEY